MPIGIDMNNYDISMGTGQIRMSGGGTFTSDNSINYDWIARASPDYTWWGACFGNGLFVVVSGADGSNNSVMTSPDGINWTLRTTPNPGSNWRAVAFGTPTSNPNGLFVAVADGGPGSRLMTSTNGIVWTARDISSNTNSWANVAYGSGYFVAVSYAGNSNRIMYSSNGINWTDVTINNTFTAHGIAFANGRFVVTPIGGSNNAYYTNTNLSTNPPSSWAQSNNINGLRWPNVAYGNGLFVAVSEGPTTVATNGTGQQQLTSHVMTSPDGITWTNRYSPDTGWVGITYGAGMFVVVAIRGAGNRVMTSPDGINWTLRPSVNDSLGWYGITYGNGIFVAASYIGSGNRVMTLDPAYGMSINKITTDETTTNLVKFGQNGATISANPSKNFAWVARTSASASPWYSICYGNGQFVAIGTGVAMTSSDGYTWISRTPADITSVWASVCYGELSGNNLYVAVTYSAVTNRVMYSSNGTSWTGTPSALANNWTAVCFGYDTSGNGLFVSVADFGSTARVMTSSNGINWTSRSSTDSNSLGMAGVCYGYDSSGQGQFVAVAYGGTKRSVYSINGGVTWIGVDTTDNNSNWKSVCYGNGTFVAVADAGVTGRRVMYSRNIIGAGWSNANYPVENGWWNVTFGNGLFVAVSTSGVGNRVMTSPDGINWTIRASTIDNTWRSVCYGNGTFVAVSSNGDISNNVMTNDYTANDNMLALNGGISPSSGQLNVKSRLFVGPDGIYSGMPEWGTTIMANTEGKVVLSTAPNGGLGGANGFQANAPFTIFDKGYSTYGIGLNIGLYRDTGSAYIQCQAANTGSRSICLQPYLGGVGIGTTSITRTASAATLLHVSGSGVDNQIFNSVTSGALDEKHWGFGPNGTSYYIYTINDAATATEAAIRMIRAGTVVSQIQLNGTTIVFNKYGTNGTLTTTGSNGTISVSSDRRIKENIVYYDQLNNIEKIKKLKPATFNFIGTKPEDKVLGFIAQDLEEVIPEAVDGKKYEYQWKKKENSDEPLLDENGKIILDYDQPRYRGVSDRAIIAIMVKAMQEQQSQIEQLQQRIQALENK